MFGRRYQILRPLLQAWPQLVPLAALAVSFFGSHDPGAWQVSIMIIAMLLSVGATVRHADVIAHRVGDPLGSLILALCVTIIEVALIASLTLSGGESAKFLARDSVFATIMIVLNGLVGFCLLLGSARHREQTFDIRGISAGLGTIATLSILVLILPNYTTTTPGPIFSQPQLGFVATVSLVLYGIYLQIQTARHKDFFISPKNTAALEGEQNPKPSILTTTMSFVFLIIALIAVVLLAESFSPRLDRIITSAGLPKAMEGLIIALIVLLPESAAAIKAARANQIQKSLNLAFGSALATIGLTIPAIASISIVKGWPLGLGLDAKETVMLFLTIVVSTISLSTGLTTVLQGAIHLVIFAVYCFLTANP